MADKSEAKHNDNYVKRICSKNKIECCNCIFVGENDYVSQECLCAKYTNEVAEVNAFGSCDKGRSRFKWYNRINPIKRYLLERSGFEFKNR